MRANLTTLIAGGGSREDQRVQLVVFGPDTFATYDLPHEGSLTVGRGQDADVRVADAFASRQHLRLYVNGDGRFEVEDLGSANGTRVRQSPIRAGQRLLIGLGETVAMGSTILVLQIAPTLRRSWPLATPKHFEAQLADACARALAEKTTFTLVWFSILEGFLGDRLAELAEPCLKVGDTLAVYGPAEYALLLPRTSAEAARSIVERLVLGLKNEGTNAASGLVSFPADARSPDDLLDRARRGLRAAGPLDPSGIAVVVKDERMKRLYDLAQTAAAGPVNVLVLGETGVGKDVMARMIHRLSPRAEGPFVRIDCASLPSSLLESELFGHERGAFTGAAQTKQGLIEAADGGTVFLDEIGELPLELQGKLLRVLETRELVRVGSVKPRSVDVRFVAATNRHLEKEIERGVFRKDLFFRLNGFSLFIPPLRDRKAEIATLARAMIWQVCQRLDRPTQPLLSREAAELLEAHAWPGNVRELRNVMERAVLLCKGEEIWPEHLLLDTEMPRFENVGPGASTGAAASPSAGGTPEPTLSRASSGVSSGVPAVGAGASGIGTGPLRRGRDADDEKRRIQDALAACGGNQSRAAKLLGMPRSTFILRLTEYGIVRPRKGNEPPET